MKFPPGFEVQFLRPGAGAAYADLTHGADRYVVGVADQPFEVRCSAPSSQFIFPVIRVVLLVDGAAVGVCKFLTAKHPSTSFNGFVTICKGQSTTRQFLFGKPDTEFGDSSSAAGSKQAGSIDVSFTAVREVPGYVPAPTSTAALQPAAASKPVEGKKWFLKPSLSTQQGQAITGVVNYNTKKYVSVKLLATCSMRMETAAILMLRKVLNPDFPLHQAIIYQSQAPEEQEDSTDQNIPPIAVSSELTSNRAVKRERTASSPSANRRVIKREPRGVFSRSCDAEEDGCIDLT